MTALDRIMQKILDNPCSACRHWCRADYEGADGDRFARCLHPQAPEHLDDAGQFADTMRGSDRYCGPAGAWFQEIVSPSGERGGRPRRDAYQSGPECTRGCKRLRAQPQADLVGRPTPDFAGEG